MFVQFFRSSLRLTALAAFAAVALCAASRPAAADDTLHVIGGSTPASFFEVLEHTAEHAGIYKSEHLIVNKEYAGSASVCVQYVATGKGDICTSSLEPLIFGYEKGIRLQVFFSRDPRYDYLLAVPDASPIRTLADFKGADIGETNTGSTSEISGTSMLEGSGLKRSDFSYVPIGTGTQAMAAINSGKVQGLSFPSVELGMYEVVGGMKFRYWKDPILSDIPNVGFAATPATIAAKGDVLKRFCRAIVKAAILIRVRPDLAGTYFLEGTGQKVTPEAVKTQAAQFAHLESDLPAVDLSNPKIGYLPLRGIEVYSKFIASKGMTKNVVPATDLVTNEFVQYANDFDKKAWIAQVKAMK
jgi:NitT/TauT family transport system substrate-binding protein